MLKTNTEFTQDHYETKAQVAKRLGVSRRTIDNLMASRKLPFFKISPKIVRFRPPDVDDYIARNFRINAIGE